MNKNWLTVILLLVLLISALGYSLFFNKNKSDQKRAGVPAETAIQNDYWMLLMRKSRQEFLFQGIPGDKDNSRIIRQFVVNVGVENERPTPLPQLFGREYWNIIAKYEVKDDPETAPYFLTLDVPWSDQYPFGPSPYNECGGEQCDWVRPGSFGLHGVAGNPDKLVDSGSSGCIRHRDEDITYLYNLLNPSESQLIRYYVKDI